MRLRRVGSTVVAGLVLSVAGALGVSPAASAAGNAAGNAEGTGSLAEVLAADGDRFDGNWNDFDILDRAVRTVLGARPDSAVGVLADGTVRLTAFLPNDRAFRRLVFGLTGDRLSSEAEVFAAVASVADVATLEAVLLYHVVPGAKITYGQAAQADGARLQTALGSGVRVNVDVHRTVRLRDLDFDAINPRVLPALRNLNQENRQIGHGISRVLRPIDL